MAGVYVPGYIARSICGNLVSATVAKLFTGADGGLVLGGGVWIGGIVIFVAPDTKVTEEAQLVIHDYQTQTVWAAFVSASAIEPPVAAVKILTHVLTYLLKFHTGPFRQLHTKNFFIFLHF